MKVIKSGNYSFGKCGQPTGLFDTCGAELFTGDVVAVSAAHALDKQTFFDFNGLCVVVADTDQAGQSDGSMFVMGLKSEHHCFLDGEPVADGGEHDHKYSVVVQNHDKWVLQKVKGWDDVVHMEKNGGITCYVIGGDV